MVRCPRITPLLCPRAVPSPDSELAPVNLLKAAPRVWSVVRPRGLLASHAPLFATLHFATSARVRLERRERLDVVIMGTGGDMAGSDAFQLEFLVSAHHACLVSSCLNTKVAGSDAFQLEFLVSAHHACLVCVFLKGKWEEIEATDTRKMFLRLQTARCHKEMKLDKGISGLSSVSWQRTWILCCELGTRGVILELRKQGSNCLGNSKLIKYLVFMWNDLLRTPSLTLAKDLDMQVKALVSVTPPVQAPYLLKCVPDRVTDDKGAMISDVILRMNGYHPQEGRWLSRTVLDHAGRECFVIRIRLGDGFWRRGAETPRAVKWEDRIIEVREGPWSYIASSVGTAPSKVVGTAVPKEKDLEEKKVTWCLSTGDMLRIQWQSGLEFQIENEDSAESARLVIGRKLQFQVKDACLEDKHYKQEEEEQFVTLIRFTQENPEGRATALLNWNLLAVEFLPEEDAVFVLLLCMAVVRTISEINREDRGHLLVRRRVKEATTGIRDWGSVMLPLGTSSSPHVNPWFWNPKEVLTSARMIDSTPMYRYSPADGKDELYKQCIVLSR
ncbi:hypothetical protein Taro_026405 [Colocasia esculenta]|uniref:GRPD C-terminal domain-containing protein n=1 Tax=Colocasia esculenta TaxID=4460 RepID=A0A843VNG9_COLES|nr:hypothetical protein [Colocasia esculenta]